MEELFAHFDNNELVLPIAVQDPNSPLFLSGERKRPLEDGFARLFLSGEFVAGGRDHRLVLQFNGETGGYNSFVKGDGNDGCGEWQRDGVLLGRNAWHLNSQFSGDICIAVNAQTQRIMTSGLTSFAASDHQLIGYQAHGFLQTSDPLKEIRLRFLSKVAVKGFAKLLLFPVPPKGS